ncbi:hypothetical protein BOTBODRAFT_175907 [Botryobasidium botryosum FD-172 SS1]|uniref:Uncharacterized protein n=1 Tax=Botryobasidium botryosum (strain FD-172 SS1) TaxID=930990 RepID=A0A067ME98_BOTB1|nr:hypothetical protein BOTBODRAFT_175907 [Botryobasidium botryosum FD-172 SS1]
MTSVQGGANSLEYNVQPSFAKLPIRDAIAAIRNLRSSKVRPVLIKDVWTKSRFGGPTRRKAAESRPGSESQTRTVTEPEAATNSPPVLHLHLRKPGFRPRIYKSMASSSSSRPTRQRSTSAPGPSPFLHLQSQSRYEAMPAYTPPVPHASQPSAFDTLAVPSSSTATKMFNSFKRSLNISSTRKQQERVPYYYSTPEEDLSLSQRLGPAPHLLPPPTIEQIASGEATSFNRRRAPPTHSPSAKRPPPLRSSLKRGTSLDIPVTMRSLQQPSIPTDAASSTSSGTSGSASVLSNATRRLFSLKSGTSSFSSPTNSVLSIGTTTTESSTRRMRAGKVRFSIDGHVENNIAPGFGALGITGGELDELVTIPDDIKFIQYAWRLRITTLCVDDTPHIPSSAERIIEIHDSSTGVPGKKWNKNRR